MLTVLCVLVQLVLAFYVTMDGGIDPLHRPVVELRVVVRLYTAQADEKTSSECIARYVSEFTVQCEGCSCEGVQRRLCCVCCVGGP